jgi:hypothetical protein
MSDALRMAARAAMLGVELGYRRAHDLQPLGRVLLLGRRRHRGTALTLPDGTRIERGAAIGSLHFNNLGFSSLTASSARATAHAFTREPLGSMQALADAARTDARLAGVVAFHATTWLPPHGERIGFVATPLPPSRAARMRTAWLRLLVWTFAPARETRALGLSPTPTGSRAAR